MSEPNLTEVFNRRLSRTRDAELKWLLETLGRGLVIANLHLTELSREWIALGLLDEKKEDG